MGNFGKASRTEVSTSMAERGSDAVLQLKGLGKSFDTDGPSPRRVLSEIDLEVRNGEFIAIVGPSGCGKTTLLRIVGGLTQASAGEVLIDGREVRGPSPKKAVVFQEDSLLPWRSALDNVRYALQARRIGSAREQIDRAQYLLELVGLKGSEDLLPWQLSGGMRQRVNLARGLACEPSLLLLDEPFAAMDAQTREDLQIELLRIWRETEATMLFITHQIDEAVYLADRVLVLGAQVPGYRESIIDIPRPRDISVKYSDDFAKMVRSIWLEVRSGHEGMAAASGKNE